jgi:two-component system, NtrC family, response regulator AtoC
MEKILVVDDELNMRLVLNAMLKKEGYEVSLAADGRQALKTLRTAIIRRSSPIPGCRKWMA